MGFGVWGLGHVYMRHERARQLRACKTLNSETNVPLGVPIGSNHPSGSSTKTAVHPTGRSAETVVWRPHLSPGVNLAIKI